MIFHTSISLSYAILSSEISPYAGGNHQPLCSIFNVEKCDPAKISQFTKMSDLRKKSGVTVWAIEHLRRTDGHIDTIAIAQQRVAKIAVLAVKTESQYNILVL